MTLLNADGRGGAAADVRGGGHRRRLPGRKALAAIVAAVLALALGIGAAFALTYGADSHYKKSVDENTGYFIYPNTYLPRPDIYLSASKFADPDNWVEETIKCTGDVEYKEDATSDIYVKDANGNPTSELERMHLFRMKDDGKEGTFSALVEKCGETMDGTDIDVYIDVTVKLSAKLDGAFERSKNSDGDPRKQAVYRVEHSDMISPTYTYDTASNRSIGISEKWTVRLFENGTFDKTTRTGTEIKDKWFLVRFDDLDARDHTYSNDIPFETYQYPISPYLEGVRLLSGWDTDASYLMGQAVTVSQGHTHTSNANDGTYWGGDNGRKLQVDVDVVGSASAPFICASHDCGASKGKGTNPDKNYEIPDSSVAFRAKSGLTFDWRGNHGCGTGLGLFATPETSKLSIKKSCIDNDDDNATWAKTLGKTTGSAYSLKGAVYGVYDTAADAVANKNVIKELTTNESGVTGKLRLQSGSYYYIKELKASPGYALDKVNHDGFGAGVYRVYLDSDTALTVDEIPKSDPIGTFALKVREKKNTQEADKPLEGAVFTVRYYNNKSYTVAQLTGDNKPTPTRTWTIKTGSDGKAALDADHLVSGTLYKDSSGDATAPLGTYSVTEKTAPPGYRRPTDVHVYVFRIEDDTGDTTEHGTTRSNLNYKTEIVDKLYKIENPPIRGDIEVKKRDQDISNAGQTGDVPEGDGTLAGAVFSIVSQNDGTITAPNGSEVSKGGEVCRITTDSTGTASTKAGTAVNGWEKPNGWSGAIEYGTYTVTEVTPPTGYRLDSPAWSTTVTVTEDGKLYTSTMTDPVKRGKVELRKADYDFHASEPQGDGTLIGTEFSVYNQSDNPVFYNGNIVATGKGKAKVNWTDAAYLVGTARVNAEDGMAVIENLPYGTYYVKETKAPAGYTLEDPAWEKTVTLHVANTGEAVSLRADADASYNKIIRGDFSLEKIDYDFFKMVTDPEPGYEADADQRYDVPEGNATLAGAEFKVYNVSAHDVWVDGRFPTLRGANGSYEITDSSQACATLTTALSGKTNSVSLPYGTYVVKETKPPSGYLLNPIMAAGVEFSVRSAGDVIITRPDVNDF